MRFTVLTLFPRVFDSYLGESILRRAQEQKLISVRAVNIRDYSLDKHHSVDAKPYGGGAGMVLLAEPILKACGSIKSKQKREKRKIIVLSAKGKQFNQKMAYNISKKYQEIVFVSGRYEGIDERVKKILKAEEVSIGPYVLTDGDVAAMVMISAISRLLPGVIRLESLAEESFWSLLIKNEAATAERYLEYPHYTRPEVLVYKGKKYPVPKVLLSGNHAIIKKWRQDHRK